MSVEAITWAINAPTTDPMMRLLLLAAANNADQNGVFRINFDELDAYFCGQKDAAFASAVEAWMSGLITGLESFDRVELRAALPLPIEPREKPRRVNVNRREVLDRDGHICAACGSINDLQIDHIIPVSRGGSDDMSNLQILCGPCNRSKGAKLPDEWEGRVNG